jgi:hypothetical protein
VAGGGRVMASGVGVMMLLMKLAKNGSKELVTKTMIAASPDMDRRRIILEVVSIRCERASENTLFALYQCRVAKGKRF